MVEKDYRTEPITFERGVIENFEDSLLPPGAAARMRNWEPDPTGGVRSRHGWSKTLTTGGPATTRGRGIGHVARPRGAYRRQNATGSNFGNTATSGSVSATWPFATATGNLLVLGVTFISSGGGVSISTPAGWTAGPTQLNGNVRTAMFYKANAASESSVVTVNATFTSGTWATACELIEYVNVSTSSPADQSDSNNDSSGPHDFGPFPSNTTQTNELVVCFGGGTNVALTFEGATITNDFEPQTIVLADSTNPTDSALCSLDKNVFSTILSSAGAFTQVTFSAGAITTEVAQSFKLTTTANGSGTDGFYFLASDDNSDSVDIYFIDRTMLATGSWVFLESVTSTARSTPVAFTSGLGSLFYTNEQWTNPRVVNVLGGASAITGVSSGRCIAFHKNRLFIAGTLIHPSRLYFSDIGDSNTWGANSYIDVSLDDGEAIEDIVPFQNALIIGKQTSLWVLNGSGPDTFQLQRLPQGGIAPGRTLMPTSYGCFAAGRKNVWLITGDTVDNVGRSIEASYGITGDYMCSSTIDDKYFVVDSATGNGWTLNLQTGVWAEHRSANGNDGPSIIFNQDYNQLYAPISSTATPMAYRTLPSSTRAKDFDSLSETYELWTRELWPVGPEHKITPRWLFLKVRQRGGSAVQTGLTVTPYFNGTASTAKTFGPESAAGVYRYRFDLGSAQGINYVQFRLSQTIPSGEASVVDIEEVEFGFYVEQVR